MPARPHRLTLSISLALMSLATHAADTQPLPEVVVHGSSTASRAIQADASTLASQQARSNDSARLLETLPGISLRAAGGLSALPVLHGLADDRLLVLTDGMALLAACPNHMNSPLSYLDSSKVGKLVVHSATAPVSTGGDHIGGVIEASQAAPRFAASGETLRSGEIGASYRSNGHAAAIDASATVANDHLSLRYRGDTARAGNYQVARDFKAAGNAASGRGWLEGDEVGSSAYRSENHSIGLAWQNDNHLLEAEAGIQRSPYQGYANQRMDMTGNHGNQGRLHYQGQYDWGTLDARLYAQYVRHSMQFGDDRQYVYGSYSGMPMETASHTKGGSVAANLALSRQHQLKLGAEMQQFSLDDWWPPAGTGSGMMSPNTFWNIHHGSRKRQDMFAEWQADWQPAWQTVLGARLSEVTTDTGNVAGYNSMASYATDAAAFNAREHRRQDHNLDLSALARYTPQAGQQWELAYARKTRSPNLYERYTWASMGMAAIMNNTAGDGNGYVGNPDLKPEVAHTVSLGGSWQDAANTRWQLRLTPYYSYVENYIDAQRCGTTLCGGSSNLTSTRSFVTLQYVNQRAQLYGADLSGSYRLAEHSPLGQLQLAAVVNYTRGKNLSTGGDLYNIMPLNSRLSLTAEQGSWQHGAEWLAVSAKTHASAARNELHTPGYSLLNLHSRYQGKHYTVDVGVDNVFNRYYIQPLGGVYIGQGMTMSKNGLAWGVGLPGPARSFYTALRYRF